jgi:hypothetical protein
MEEWHEVWKPKEKLLDKSLKYILPIGVILFFILFTYHVYFHILPIIHFYGVGEIILWYLLIFFAMLVVFFICRTGLRQQIRIYKEGIWLNSTELDFLLFKIRTKWTRSEKWIRWEDIEGLSIRNRISLSLTGGMVDLLFIDIITKDGTYQVVLNAKDAVEMRDAIIKEGYEEKLKS